jgi:hypothetical protein
MHAIHARSNRGWPLKLSMVPVIAPAPAPATIASPIGLDMNVAPVTLAPAAAGNNMIVPPVAAPAALQKNSRWNQLASGESVGL